MKRGRGAGAILGAAMAAAVLACGALPRPTPVPLEPSPTAGLATGTATAGSPSPSPAPTSAPSLGPTPGPTLPSVSWDTVLGPERTYGPFTVAPDAKRARELIVRRAGRIVGRVSFLTLAAEDWPGSLVTIEDLLRFAANYVDQFRDTRLHDLPDSTFDAVGPVEASVGPTLGVRFGWLWRDRSGHTERTIDYVARIPGGIAWFKAVAGGVPGDLPWSTFPDDADLAAFLSSLEQLITDVHLPPTS